MINDLSQIHIGGWMINDLKLSGNALIVFALIFSFTNGTEDHAFHGSANYIAEWCGISRRAVMDILKKLVEDGLIVRKDAYVNGVKFVDYFIPCEVFAHHNNMYIYNNIGCEDSAQGMKLGADTNLRFLQIWENIPSSKGGDESIGLKEFQKKLDGGACADDMLKVASLDKFEVREKVRDITYSKKKENWIRDFCSQDDDIMESRILAILQARYKRVVDGVKFKANTVAELCDIFGKQYIEGLWKQVQKEYKETH